MKFPRYSMRFYPGFVPPLCLAVALTACSPAGEPQGPATAADLAAINGVHDEYFSAMNSGDAAGYVARLTEDVVFMPPNEQATIGQEANRARIQRAFDQAEFENDLLFGGGRGFRELGLRAQHRLGDGDPQGWR